MAYVSQELKRDLIAEAKRIIPADWRVTFAVRHHSTLVATIRQAPASVLADYIPTEYHREGDMPHVNHHNLAGTWRGETLATLEALRAALMRGNHDRSDTMTDYFDVGWYLEIGFGQWNKPCEFVAAPVEDQAA